ncbi:unnamed protein product [Polarella glacialis]|uniref:Uncharacterized protein n=1 Tax=Polarella glacialis TaxID=89957 RepID=A0A813KPM0_POLGL|nr:unnamed protein product [Polarella glacialis]
MAADHQLSWSTVRLSSKPVLQVDSFEDELELLWRRTKRWPINSAAFLSADSGGAEALARRRAAVEELTGQFALHDYRDEWLAAVVFLMDRAAASQESGSEAAIFACKPLWRAAVLLVFKLAGADTELDCDVKDLLTPLMRDLRGLKDQEKALATCWEEALAAEFRLCRLLDFNLQVPTPLDLVGCLSSAVLSAAAGSTSPWPGVVKGRVSVAASLASARVLASTRFVSTTRFESLAAYLLELAMFLRPEEAYGRGCPMAVLVMAVVSLALHGFCEEGAAPPEPCVAALAAEQKRLLPAAADEKQLLWMLESLHLLWARSSASGQNSVAQKWSDRATGLQGELPRHAASCLASASAHALATASPLVTSTPQRQLKHRLWCGASVQKSEAPWKRRAERSKLPGNATAGPSPPAKSCAVREPSGESMSSSKCISSPQVAQKCASRTSQQQGEQQQRSAGRRKEEQVLAPRQLKQPLWELALGMRDVWWGEKVRHIRERLLQRGERSSPEQRTLRRDNSNINNINNNKNSNNNSNNNISNNNSNKDTDCGHLKRKPQTAFPETWESTGSSLLKRARGESVPALSCAGFAKAISDFASREACMNRAQKPAANERLAASLYFCQPEQKLRRQLLQNQRRRQSRCLWRPQLKLRSSPPELHPPPELQPPEELQPSEAPNKPPEEPAVPLQELRPALRELQSFSAPGNQNQSSTSLVTGRAASWNRRAAKLLRDIASPE